MKAYVLPTYHPARILRGGHALDMPSREHLRHAAQCQEQLSWGRHPSTWVDLERPVAGAVLEPALCDLHEWARGDLSQGVALDIEDIGILLGVGLCRVADEVPLWVPFRTQDGTGAMYWDADELPQVVDWLQHLIDTVPLVMHNGQAADVPWLERTGFSCAGYEMGADTMLMAHLALPEVPKGLQFLSTLWLRMRNWKSLAPSDDDEAMEEAGK